MHHYTFLPLLLLALLITASLSILAAGPVPLGIVTDSLAKSGSLQLDSGIGRTACGFEGGVHGGEWAAVYVRGGEPHTIGYQAAIEALKASLAASEHVASVQPRLRDVVTSRDDDVTGDDDDNSRHGKADDAAAGGFAAALHSHVHAAANARHAARVLCALSPLAPPPDAAAVAAGGDADARLGARAARAAHLAHLAATSNRRSPPRLLTTRALHEAEVAEGASARLSTLRIPFELAACHGGGARSGGDAGGNGSGQDRADGAQPAAVAVPREDCQLRQMTAVRALVAEAAGGALDARVHAPSFLVLEQHAAMRADVRRSLLRCTLAAVAVTLLLSLRRSSAYEAAVVSAACALSLAAAIVVILGLIKALDMSSHWYAHTWRRTDCVSLWRRTDCVSLCVFLSVSVRV